MTRPIVTEASRRPTLPTLRLIGLAAAVLLAVGPPLSSSVATADAFGRTTVDASEGDPLDASPSKAGTASFDAAGHDAAVHDVAVHGAGTHDGGGGHAEHGGGHADPAAPLLLAIVLILLFAKLAGDLFERVSLPAVLGELVVGVLLGNWGDLTGSDALAFLQVPNPATASVYDTGAILQMLASLGVIILLFEVGLESSVREMLSVGKSSLFVALLGVIAPIGLGYGVSAVLVDEPWQVHAFVGATLCATSVGITARVLKDLGRSQQRESQIILGAAVIDDVLGLLVLAVVSGVIQQGADFDPAALVAIVVKAFGFLFVAIVLGASILVRPLFTAACRLRGSGLLVVTALSICFFMAWVANKVGLAPIVGAFAAGLILERTAYRDLAKREHVELEEAIEPIAALLVPIFFVQMGLQVKLSSFSSPSVWLLAGALTVAAIIGKQVCSLGVVEDGLNKTAVGLGMIPRGEVGLIFAAEGAKLVVDGEPVISSEIYSAIVVMVMLTTMLTPPALQWSLRQSQPQTDPGETALTSED